MFPKSGRKPKAILLTDCERTSWHIHANTYFPELDGWDVDGGGSASTNPALSKYKDKFIAELRERKASAGGFPVNNTSQLNNIARSFCTVCNDHFFTKASRYNPSRLEGREDVVGIVVHATDTDSLYFALVIMGNKLCIKWFDDYSDYKTEEIVELLEQIASPRFLEVEEHCFS